jgi:hypothetical protein
MPLLTIFSAPKPFTDPHINMIQRNAIQSWTHLGSEVEVFLVGEEPGLAEAAAEYNVLLLKEVRRNEAGTPLINSIFDLARQASSSPYLLFVNGDILLTRDILTAARQIQAQPPQKHPFLLLGQRWDLAVTQLLDFTSDWEKRLREDTQAHGSLHPPAGSDYFLFPKEAFSGIPDLAVGRAGWDNWMIYYACRQGWQVIDGTPSVMIIHQNHDYSHLSGGKPHYNHAESEQNMLIAGGLAHMYTVLDAPYELINGRLHPARLTRLRFLRAFERWLMPAGGKMRGARGFLARRFRRMRRKLEKNNL